jgi:hypothetical protein
VPLLILVANFLLKSSNIFIIAGIELAVIYCIKKITSEFSNSDIAVIIILLLFNDVILYTQVGVASMIFFGAYIIISLIERAFPFFIKNFPVNTGFLLFVIYFALRAVLIHDVSLTSVIINLILLIVILVVFPNKKTWKNEISK